MTEDTARKVADVLIGGALVAAAFYIARTPSLRREAWRLIAGALTGTLPVWIGREVGRAWAESGRRTL